MRIHFPIKVLTKLQTINFRDDVRSGLTSRYVEPQNGKDPFFATVVAGAQTSQSDALLVVPGGQIKCT